MTQDNDDSELSVEAGENPQWIKHLEDPGEKQVYGLGENRLETEPHFHLVVIADPMTVEQARQEDLKQLEPGRELGFCTSSSQQSSAAGRAASPTEPTPGS